MSKQVLLNSGALTVFTSYASEPIKKVVVLKKGTYPKEYYPLGNMIRGYEAEKLLILSEILKDKEVTPKMLSDFTTAYMDGYQRAYSECQNSIEQSIKRMFDELRG